MKTACRFSRRIKPFDGIAENAADAHVGTNRQSTVEMRRSGAADRGIERAMFEGAQRAGIPDEASTAELPVATATHIRASDPYFMPPVVGVLVWAGLYLRDERIRALLPLLSSKR